MEQQHGNGQLGTTPPPSTEAFQDWLTLYLPTSTHLCQAASALCALQRLTVPRGSRPTTSTYSTRSSYYVLKERILLGGWQRYEELCVAFVAVTRAKNRSFYSPTWPSLRAHRASTSSCSPRRRPSRPRSSPRGEWRSRGFRLCIRRTCPQVGILTRDGVVITDLESTIGILFVRTVAIACELWAQSAHAHGTTSHVVGASKISTSAFTASMEVVASGG